MSHDYHPNPDAVLSDECEECHGRVNFPYILNIDEHNLIRLWEEEKRGDRAQSRTDAKARRTLYEVHVMLERLGIDHGWH